MGAIGFSTLVISELNKNERRMLDERGETEYNKIER
jgi:hypothetical protein